MTPAEVDAAAVAALTPVVGHRTAAVLAALKVHGLRVAEAPARVTVGADRPVRRRTAGDLGLCGGAT